MTTSRTLLSGFIVLLFIVLLSVRAVSAQETRAVRLSYTNGWDATPAIVAIEKGFLAEQALVVNGLALPSVRTILESLAGGTTDFGVLPNRTLILVAGLRLPLKIVARSGWGAETEIVVPSDATTATIQDLRGKTIALGVATEAFPLFIRFATQKGLKPGEVTIKNLVDSADILRALDRAGCAQVKRADRQGRQTDICADAVIASRHFTSRLAGPGKARVLTPYAELVKATGVRNAGALVTRTTLIETDPDLVQRFVNGWTKALQHTQAHQTEAADLMQVFFARQGTQVPKDLARLWVQLERYDGAEWTGADTADTEANAAALQQIKVLQTVPKLGPFVDARFTQRAR